MVKLSMLLIQWSGTAFFTIFLLVCSQSAWPASSVWVVQKGQSKIFIAGSIHLLRASDHPLPPEFSNALDQSDEVLFETDVEALNGEAARKQLRARGFYKLGETLRNHIRPNTLLSLERYCTSRGLSIDSLLPLKPWMIAMNLALLELQASGISDQDGVESTILRQSRKQGKPVRGLVSVEEHFSTLAALDQIPADDLILHTLSEIEQTASMAHAIIAAWRKGEVLALEKMFINPLNKTYPAIFKALLTDRNKRWIPLLEALLERPRPALVVVGVAHLVGEQNVLALLAEKGFTVKRF